jgi:hypothetical protein
MLLPMGTYARPLSMVDACGVTWHDWGVGWGALDWNTADVTTPHTPASFRQFSVHKTGFKCTALSGSEGLDFT